MALNHNFIAKNSIIIAASPEAIWDALTNPAKIKIYLFGTETITDWKVGSPIIFQGEYEGSHYKDKGVVLTHEPLKNLTYSYWSGFSGLEDREENYARVSYLLKSLGKNQTELTWHQAGFANEENQVHTQNGLPTLLEQIKNLAEAKP